MKWPSPLSFVLTATGLAFIASLAVPGWQRTKIADRVKELRSDTAEIEKAVARAASAQSLPAGASIAPEAWLPYLPKEARPTLREKATDPFGRPYGPQLSDRPVQVPEMTLQELRRVGFVR